MPKSLTKVIYKPDHTSNSEYTVIVNPEEFKKLCFTDTSIPLAEVVDSFTIFHSTQGRQGYLGQPSKQQLDTDFGTSNDTDVVKIILEKGKDQAADSIGLGTGTEKNLARGGGSVDLNRGGLNRGGRQL
ncbi:hypothetical protein DXG03_000186 [Asterophora parasitica]|uniref:Ribosome maturation protein SDO1/SBDS N-terminal domain-containing protein n=1 Tax=Asterophora parasitica TaxID=117018 RepID=A0A9P7GKU9_9AGAR|nr:hypothetical protein DXG03_000186 [Asterophora parasitica]